MTETKEEVKRIVHFIYEMASASTVTRGHKQRLLVDDPNDNIAVHTHDVTKIGWVLASMENVDVNKVIKMCLVHDDPEIRTSDHHWVNKRYITEDEEKARMEQISKSPMKNELEQLYKEYEERKSPESIVAKDADTLAAILYLRIKAWQGNKEAERWLIELPELKKKLKTDSAKALAEEIYLQSPCEWQDNLYVT
jgi:putative hydrolase of HD superfamily